MQCYSMSECVLTHVNMEEEYRDGRKDKLPLLYVNDPKHTRSSGSVFHLYLYHLDGRRGAPRFFLIHFFGFHTQNSVQPVPIITSLIQRGTYQRDVRVFASHCDLTCRLCVMRSQGKKKPNKKIYKHNTHTHTP